MHFNCAKIIKTVEICMELFFRTIVTTSCWQYRWELSDSSQFRGQLEYERHQFFLLTLYRVSKKLNSFKFKLAMKYCSNLTALTASNE